MARIKDDKVVAVGLPDSLESTEPDRLYSLGWRQVKGLPKPGAGRSYEYTHPFTYSADEDAVYGTWQQTDVLDRINEAKAKGIREQRDALLDESDFAVLADSPVSNVEDWKTYRQALRDVPQQEGFPQEVVWPNPPA